MPLERPGTLLAQEQEAQQLLIWCINATCAGAASLLAGLSRQIKRPVDQGDGSADCLSHMYCNRSASDCAWSCCAAVQKP